MSVESALLQTGRVRLVLYGWFDVLKFYETTPTVDGEVVEIDFYRGSIVIGGKEYDLESFLIMARQAATAHRIWNSRWYSASKNKVTEFPSEILDDASSQG